LLIDERIWIKTVTIKTITVTNMLLPDKTCIKIIQAHVITYILLDQAAKIK